jgi:alcohol dehydrogenase class IV
VKQKVYIGPGSIHRLHEVLSARRLKSVFLVTGGESFSASGADRVLDPMLAGRQVTHYSDFEKNPTLEDLYRGLSLFERADYDLVLAIGGGSVLDMAKMINFFYCNAIDPLVYVNSEIDEMAIGPNRPLVAIPTTAGSGSEATRFAVLYVDYIKHSVEHETILPQVAIVDPELCRSLPPAVTAAAGLDAFCQAVESFWSIRSTEESKHYSAEAIRLSLANLVSAVKNPDDRSRAAMASAAHLAGRAINIAKTTAAHALSYPLTSHFKVPHGQAVAVTLPSFFRFNAGVEERDVLDPRGVDYVRGTVTELIDMLGASGVEQATGKIEDLIRAVGMAARPAELGLGAAKELVATVQSGYDSDRAGNNPRRLTKEDVEGILLE